MIGRTVSHYKILEELGQGGMGVVYLAEDNKLHRKVALKFLFQNLYNNTSYRERFEREAQAAAALTHPNIVVVYEIDEFEGQIYISMEYIQGESLRQYIEKQQYSLNESLDIMLQICEGLSCAHEANIVHRDIKPENIIISRNLMVKIVDFGLAKLKNLYTLTATRTQMGTAQYMSPEQARGEEVDHGSDIFSLGAILYELLSGRLAFSGDDPVKAVHSVINEDPEPLPDVPPDLYKIIKKALKKKRAERYGTLREMISELHAVQRRLEIGASGGEKEKSTDTGRNASSLAAGSFTHSSEAEHNGAEISRQFTPQMESDKIGNEVAKKTKNPYMNRVKIKNMDEFYGRKSEVSKIFSRIGSSRPQSVSIVGERRIGKSSLLNYISHPEIRTRYLQTPDDYRFVFIDFQEKRGIDISTFFQSIYAVLLDESKGGLALDVQPDYDGFKELLTAYDQHDLKIIILFDEFESITLNQNFDLEFYSFLRSIANNYDIGYIVASGKTLQTLCHSQAISHSPFFNIFSHLTLTSFSQQESLELITGPSQKFGYSLEYYAPFVFEIAGYYPFFIQMACAVLFEYVRGNEMLSENTLDSAKEEFLDEAKVHFQQIWDSCDDEERDVFLKLCHHEKIPDPQKYVLKNLTKRGYIKTGKNQSLVFSSLFEEFLLARYGSNDTRKKKKFLF